MTDLRRKVGHERGKAWTALLNRLVGHIVELRNQQVVAKELDATLLKEHRTKLGPMVIAVGKLTRTSDGTIVEGWENEKMCSNPRHRCNAPSRATDKAPTNQVPAGSPASYLQGNQLVDDYKDYWSVNGPWTCSIANLLAETTKVATPPSTTQPQR